MLEPHPHGGIVVHDLLPSPHLWQLGFGHGPEYRVAAVSFEKSRLDLIRTILERSSLALTIPPDATLASTLASGDKVKIGEIPEWIVARRQIWRALRAETTPYTIRLILDHAAEFAEVRGHFAQTASPGGFLTVAYAQAPIEANSVRGVLADLNSIISRTPIFFHSPCVIIRTNVPNHPFTFRVEKRIPYHLEANPRKGK